MSVLECRHYASGISLQDEPGLRERDLLPYLFEQLDSELFLKQPNTYRNARLTEMHFFTGAGEIQVSRNCEKDFEVTRVHVYRSPYH